MQLPSTLETAPSGAQLRRACFLAQDGLVLSVVLWALDDTGILRSALPPEPPAAAAPSAGFGALRVVLRTLVSQGWLAQPPGGDPAGALPGWTDEGRAVAAHHDDYIAVGRFLIGFDGTDAAAWRRPWSAAALEQFAVLAERAAKGWGLDDLPPELRSVVAGHLDGALATPLLLTDPAQPLPAQATDVLRAGHWDISATARYASMLGMSGSYLPMFARLPDMIRGSAVVRQADDGEWHVNRALNVNASAAAHGRYFSDALDVVLDLFDHPDLDAQPAFIADVGCGNGRWLQQLHDAIRDRTLRGRHLATHPLEMVGVDANHAALEEARRLLDGHGIPALLLIGDISAPDAIAATLARHGLAMTDGLHVRAFIDHDRTYLGPRSAVPPAGAVGDGAYIDPDGNALFESEAEQDLVEHLRRWLPHVRRHGLIVIEAHAVAPRVIRRHAGATHSVAFDTYHGLSHQYPIDYGRWLSCCRQAGLETVLHETRRYPAEGPFVAVSITRLVPATERPMPVAVPSSPRGAARGDGQALHELLFADGDAARPRPWCAEPTGWLVAGAVEEVERRLATAAPGEAIRVLDYGAGTGLATIELIKALTERHVPDRLAARAVRLELHLVDLPGDWFTFGRRLLEPHPWVEAHDLLTAGGAFRPLGEVLSGRTVDLALASMVFHLIPLRALPTACAGLAGVLRPGGTLLWNAPDIGPTGPSAVLFHDPNRAVRHRLLRDPSFLRRVTPETRQRAGRRILPQPRTVAEIAEALQRYLTGSAHQRSYEMLPEEFADTLLVPSNAAEFLPEFDDPEERTAAIRAGLAAIVAELRDGPAGTAHGLNVRWTFGRFMRDPAATR